MLKKNTTIILLLLLSFVSFYFYFQYKTPSGFTSQGDNEELIEWILLATGIIELLTAIVGLIQKFLKNEK